jgi:hypothetical protein
MTLVKSAPKKSFAKKTIFLGLRQIFKWLNSFLAKIFLGALFTKVICTFLKSVRKGGFFIAPFDLFKEKNFHLLEGTMNFFKN